MFLHQEGLMSLILFNFAHATYIVYVSIKVDRFPILSKWVGYFDPHPIRSKIWCNIIEKSYGGRNRKYRFVHFPQTFSYLFVYQKSIARGKRYNYTMKTTKMTKKHIIPKTEINLVNLIRFVYSVCIIFETTTLCYLFSNNL